MTRASGTADPIAVGVIGVGSMGRNHARVYRELSGVDLVGVADVNETAAREVAAEYDTSVRDADDLLAVADAVSVAAPTATHAPLLERCIDAHVHALIEKPFVTDPGVGHTLAQRARDAGITIQVGHIERFNPAIRALVDVVPDLDVLAVDARRLGPPVDRAIDRSAVFDLMIHDLDVVCALLGGEPTSVSATGAADNRYATATCEFDDVVASFTASRVTQRKVRRLGVTARQCRVRVDYMDQSVEIHRHSTPSYVEDDGGVRQRVESVVERPIVHNGEPLKRELDAFATAIREGSEPVVTAEDGLRAVSLARRIDELAADKEAPEVAS